MSQIGTYTQNDLWSRFAESPPSASSRSRGFAGVALNLADPLVNAGFTAFFDWLCRLRVYGETSLEHRGYLFASNHGSHLDSLVFYWSLPKQHRRRTCYFAAKEWFSRPPLNYFAHRGHAIQVDRYGDPLAALPIGVKVLRSGGSLLVFPAGHRLDTVGVAPFKPGVGFLACVTGIPVVPVYIAGTIRVLPRHHVIPRPGRLAVHFGQPVTAEAVLGAPAAHWGYEEFGAFASYVEDRVRDLMSLDQKLQEAPALSRSDRTLLHSEETTRRA